ncbi:MAG: hypothetical protein ACM3UT_14985, partial [Chloroflexota bacterium]
MEWLLHVSIYSHDEKISPSHSGEGARGERPLFSNKKPFFTFAKRGFKQMIYNCLRLGSWSAEIHR